MKTTSSTTSSKRPLVILEPALEIQVITSSPSQRRRLARVYLRWARQLFVSARILERAAAPRPRATSLSLHPRKAALN